MKPRRLCLSHFVVGKAENLECDKDNSPGRVQSKSLSAALLQQDVRSTDKSVGASHNIFLFLTASLLIRYFTVIPLGSF